jgi:hypothetical protein
LRQQVAFSYRGAGPANETSWLVAEYVLRQRLSKLGYRTDTGGLSAVKAEAFGVIAAEIDQLREKELKKSRKGR